MSSSPPSPVLTQTRVVFLDDTSQLFVLDKKARGSSLLDRVFDHLELVEREYFGLIFNDAGGTLPSGHSPGKQPENLGKFVRLSVQNLRKRTFLRESEVSTLFEDRR